MRAAIVMVLLLAAGVGAFAQTNVDATKLEADAAAVQEAETDQEIVQAIRQSIRKANGGLSHQARNITISSLDGNVRLSGYVHTVGEITMLRDIAFKVSGVKSVDHESLEATALTVR